MKGFICFFLKAVFVFFGFSGSVFLTLRSGRKFRLLSVRRLKGASTLNPVRFRGRSDLLAQFELGIGDEFSQGPIRSLSTARFGLLLAQIPLDGDFFQAQIHARDAYQAAKPKIQYLLGGFTRMPDSTSSKFAEEQKQPLFTAIATSDADFREAYVAASRTLPRFIEHLQSGIPAYFSAKLRFRDPDESERLGEDQLLYLWLTSVHYQPSERIFSGIFFEVPPELQKWHQVGQRLTFKGEDIFDWMMLTEDGRLFGGFTLRVSRSKLPESERADYDRYIGVRIYEPAT